MAMGRAHKRSTAQRAAIGLACSVLTVLLTGCGVLAKELSDGDFAETIPAALAASDLGVTDSGASEGLDGFTFYVYVGIDIDRDEVTADDLATILRIILENNDVPSDEIRLTVDGPDGESIGLAEVVDRIDPELDARESSLGGLSVTNEQAIEIVKAVWGD